jgi:hypothetical protein
VTLCNNNVIINMFAGLGTPNQAMADAMLPDIIGHKQVNAGKNKHKWA